METLKTPILVASTLIAGTLLLSSTLLNDHRASSTSSSLSYQKDEALSGFVAGGELSAQNDQPPAAEDVLIQRIPGDNGHVLIMAYYSKERFSGSSVTINNESAIVLKDDGKGDDKVAGDGLYTARISADIGAFKNQALGLVTKMKDKKYEPISYLDRQRIVDPGAAENFDIAKFDANEPVSISGLTNALSTDFKPAATTQNSLAASSSLSHGSLGALPSLDAIKQNSIFITNLAVVEDPTRTWNFRDQTGNLNGPWTFNTLMRQLASRSRFQSPTDAQLSDFVKNWLNQLGTPQIVNGDAVPGRVLFNTLIMNPWLAASKAAGAPDGQLDMHFAPFKLTAITNRFDLRSGTPNGESSEAVGEGRFIFTLVSSVDTAFVDPVKIPFDVSFNIHKGDPLLFNVIFEYHVNKLGFCSQKHAWAQQWVNLANLTLGSSDYNTALQKITDQYALSGTNPFGVNQSSLGQLRTNEVALDDLRLGVGTWQLREFKLTNVRSNTRGGFGNSTAILKMGTVGQTPADKFNGSLLGAPNVPITVNQQDVQRMADYVNFNSQRISNGFFTVPATWERNAFLGGASRVLGFPVKPPVFIPIPTTGYFWNGGGTATITDDNARFNFSMQTCSGCHSGEAQCFFTHVDNVGFGQEATLSGFVNGKGGQLGFAVDADGNDNDGVFSVIDPAGRPSANPTLRSFNEIDRRGKDLLSFVSTSCGSIFSISSQLMFQPLGSSD